MKPKLIAMLTNNDRTVLDAREIFEQCKTSKAEYWGFKEIPLPLTQMKSLCSSIKNCGKTAVLEVVAYAENECVQGAKTAVECGFDILMGTTYSDKVNEICKANGIKYMPFVGKVSERPSILNGNIDDMISEAKTYLEKGVYGIDLLAYRFTQNSSELIQRFMAAVKVPVCIAGSVNSFERLDEIKSVAPEFFTIGSAFFEKRFGQSLSEQIDRVCDYIC